MLYRYFVNAFILINSGNGSVCQA